jgi:uncharacterized protein (TIGR02147 family)
VRVEQTNAIALRGPDARVVRALARDAIDTLSTWHDWAILELLRVEDFVSDVRWIARVLDASVDDVQLALQRLVRLGFLEMAGSKRWVDRTGDRVDAEEAFRWTAVERLADALRELMLRAARDGTPADRWIQCATTIAVAEDAVPHAMARIERFRADLVDLLERDARRDAVYHLAIGFVPVTRSNDKEKDDGKPRDAMADGHA